MINKVIILGRVGSDPEVKVSAREEKFAGMSVATSEKYKNKQGEWQEKTQWHRVVCWDPNVAATIEKFVRKGTTVYLEGQVETRSYDQQGETPCACRRRIGGYTGIGARPAPLGVNNETERNQ